MKSFTILVLVLAACAFGALAQGPTHTTDDINGLQLGKFATEPLGFYGATPVGQPSAIGQLALSDSTAGVIPSPVTITGTAALPFARVTVTTGTGGYLSFPGAKVGDQVLSAVFRSGTATVSGTADFEVTVSGTDQILQTGTASGVGKNITVTLGRYPSAQYVVLAPVTSGTNSTAQSNANFAVLARSINALRDALVKEGLIKGGN